MKITKTFLAVLAVLVFFIAQFFSPAFSRGSDAQKGKYWYHEAGCDMCHGEKGRGDGSSGATLNPKPADYCTSKKALTDAEKIKIITEGGASVGRSPDMPSWGESLDKEAIEDIVAYIHVLCPNIKQK